MYDCVKISFDLNGNSNELGALSPHHLLGLSLKIIRKSLTAYNDTVNFGSILINLCKYGLARNGEMIVTHLTQHGS